MNFNTLYVSDLDGTLLDSNSLIDSVSAEIISDLTADGATFSVATARTPATVVPLLSQTASAPLIIVMTGATLFNRETLEFVDPMFLSTDAFTRTCNVLSECSLSPFSYFLNPDNRSLSVFHSFEMSREEEKFYRERRNLSLKTFHIGSEPPTDYANRCMLLFATGPTEQIQNAAKQLSADCDLSISAYPDIFNPDISLIEIFTAGVSKAERVRELAKLYNKNRIVVFGDNLNDLPMMDVADVSVAVGNANPVVKTKADIVIGTNSSNAVANFIRKDFITT